MSDTNIVVITNIGGGLHHRTLYEAEREPKRLLNSLRRGYADAAVCGVILLMAMLAIFTWTIHV
jgi:hypothetical protein